MRNSPSPSKTGRPDHQGRFPRDCEKCADQSTGAYQLVMVRGPWVRREGLRGREARAESKANCDCDRDRPSASWYVLYLARLPSVDNLRHGRVLADALHDDRREASSVYTIHLLNGGLA